MIQFKPIEPREWPHNWVDGTKRVGLRILCLLPFGQQVIVISHPSSSDGFVMRDNGHSALVERWDHTICITSAAGKTLYRDAVTIDAGLLTLPVWLFTQVFYQHRQRRWRLQARRGFRY